MNKNSNSHACKHPRLKWLRAMLLQMILTLAAFLLLDLSLWIGGPLYFLCKWVCTPILGLISAYLSTRAGFLNYLAFLVPPLMIIASSLILWGYLPQPAPVILCGFISLIGAAAGEVIKQSHRRHK